MHHSVWPKRASISHNPQPNSTAALSLQLVFKSTQSSSDVIILAHLSTDGEKKEGKTHLVCGASEPGTNRERSEWNMKVGGFLKCLSYSQVRSQHFMKSLFQCTRF